MRRRVAPIIFAVAACVLTARHGMAQTAESAPPLADTASGDASAWTRETTLAEDANLSSAAAAERGAAGGFLHDVGGDYLHFFSKETAAWLGVGGLMAFAVHPVDKNLSDWALNQNVSLTGGEIYGSQLLHIPVAIGIWAIGAAAGSGQFADAGRDLLRAQIAVGSWTYAIKAATQRTRPNGDPRSFPSGHASTSFATAMVLQEHFGWKAGIPAFAAAAYTAVSRVAANQHWASDVVFGAAVGLASGRTVTIQLRETRVGVAPLAVPGGGGALVTAVW